MLNDIQITSDYMFRWVVLKRRVTSQRVLKVLFYVNIFNKGIDAIDISNILNRKEVVKEISPYFKNQSGSIVSYSYTNSIGRTIFNYKEAWKRIYASFVKYKIPKIIEVVYM
jgi:hypothetical protein